MAFEEKYFVQSQTSNYKDYRKKKFKSLVDDLIEFFKLKPTTRILDFGCATGGLLKEFKNRGYKKIKGTDPSFWAIEYGHKKFKLIKELEFYNVSLLTMKHDLTLFLDVLEHVPTEEEIQNFLRLLKLSNTQNVVVRVPVSASEGKPYVLAVSNNDKTHVQCHTKRWWKRLFEKGGYKLVGTIKGKSIYDSDGVFVGVFKICK